MVRRRVAAWPLLVALGLFGCGSGSDEGGETVASELATGELRAPAERLDETWVVMMATEDAVGPYAGNEGWVSLVLRRNLRQAVEQHGASGGIATARAHVEAAAMFRQAALLSANALVETYGETPEPTDPIGTAHLLTVGYALNGELDKAREAAGRLADVDDPTQVWHAPWKAWLDGGAAWPPELDGLPITLPDPMPGTWPELTEVPPHYALPEQGADTTVDMGDPSVLVALALWHDAAAKAAAPDHAAALDVARAGYRLPIEAVVEPGEGLPFELIFGSDLVVPGDGPFLAALHGEQGVGAVDAHADTSLLAWLAQVSRVDGKIDAERAVDVLSLFRADLVERAASRTENTVQGHHPRFADIAFVGAFRSLALVAEVEGDREASGLMRINAMERSQKETACPAGLLALGAWDASNRYPTRAQDILHGHARRYPSLEAARYGLDVMALRVSRERPGETPGM